MNELTTDRFRLRLAGEDDAALFFELDADPAVMTYINGGTPSTSAETVAAAKRVGEVARLSGNRFGVWFAFHRESGEYVGWVLLRPDKAFPEKWEVLEVGYRLKKKWWGQGVASELGRRMVNYAFREQGAREVFAIALKTNLASQAVMRKLGLRYAYDYVEEQFPGVDKDAVRFRLTADAYDP